MTPKTIEIILFIVILLLALPIHEYGHIITTKKYDGVDGYMTYETLKDEHGRSYIQFEATTSNIDGVQHWAIILYAGQWFELMYYAIILAISYALDWRLIQAIMIAMIIITLILYNPINPPAYDIQRLAELTN